MSDNNKVEFGLKNFYVGTYTVAEDGTVTLGAPYHQKGAINISMDSDSSQSDFYADDTKYWSGFQDNGMTGSIEVAKFDRAFKAAFLGYEILDDGGLAKIKGAIKPDVYMMFETSGNVEGRRVIVYNVALGAVSREYSTIEESKEPVTETIDFSASGDNGTGITATNYWPEDEGYDTMFDTPPVPRRATTPVSS